MCGEWGGINDKCVVDGRRDDCVVNGGGINDKCLVDGRRDECVVNGDKMINVWRMGEGLGLSL